jgi:UMF1 family MFS transporter
MKSDQKKIMRSWIMYDWANSAFATTIMAAVLPDFYSKVAGLHLGKTLATSYWGYTQTIAMVVIAFISPILGAISDYTGRKKRFLGVFVAMGIIGTGLLTGISQGMWLWASMFYILGRIGFGGGNTFYDSFLPHISGSQDMDAVSAKGYAYGYLGGGLLLALNLIMIMKPGLFGIPGAEWGARLSFLTVAVWWACFSIPIFRNVPEPIVFARERAGLNPVMVGYTRLISTFESIRRFKELVKFLLAFWLYNDGVGTIITMAVVFGSEIGIGSPHLIGAILLVQFLGLPFTLVFGKLPKKLGTKRSILLALCIYACVTILGYFMTQPIHFWVLAFLVAMVQGGTQALSRSMYGSMAPLSKSAEFFGFYNMSSKFAGIIGPFLFGIVGQITGTGRLSILAIISFFIIGGAILVTVDHHAGIEVARVAEEEERKEGPVSI